MYIWAMPDESPLCLSKVLQEEYQALRSDSSSYYKPVNPAAPESALLAEIYQKVHRQSKPFTALCISGGGIRSATFALGAIQSMADHGYLAEFDYWFTHRKITDTPRMEALVGSVPSMV